MAPFMPFVADDIYKRVNGALESVHLETWPVAKKVDVKLLADMKRVRAIASQGLEARMSAKINVRQPLQSLKVKGAQGLLNTEMISIIADEVNVKAVIFGEVEGLDTSITPALKEEGMLREFFRAIQDLRKAKGLTISDKASLIIETDDAGKKFIEKNKEAIMRATLLKSIEWGNVEGEAVKIGEMLLKLGINI